jgi:hypothetical protein
MQIIKKFAAVCVQAFGPVIMVGGVLMMAIAWVADVNGSMGSSTAFFSLTRDQIYRLAVVMFAAGGALTVLRHEWELHDVRSLFGNEASRLLMSEGIPPTIDYYHQYVGRGDYGIVNRFWQAGISGGRDSQGKTDLHIACQMGHPAIVQELLRRGADPLVTTPEGHTSLMMAAVGGNVRIVDILSDHRFALEAGTTDGGCSALYMAAARGHLAATERFIEFGAIIDRPDNANLTPLMAAIAQRHYDVARFLIDAGADVSRRDASGATLLDYAETFACPDDILERIVARGVTRCPDGLNQRSGGCKWDGHVRVGWRKASDSTNVDVQG